MLDLTALTALGAQLSAPAEGLSQAALVERISALEKLKAAAAAGQARATAALDAARRAAEAAAGVPAVRRGRGLGGEVALARQDSPDRGNRHLGLAKALVHEMPHTLAALATGVLSEWRATILVRESACLTVADRRLLDAKVCADPAALTGVGDARLAATARRIAYELDARAVVDRAAKAATERRVTIRPAPDTMAYVTALLPMAQGVAVYAALRRAADSTGGGRSRGQVMADTLVERVTGRPAAAPVPVTVDLVLSDEVLLGSAPGAAEVCGYGPIPAAVALDWIRSAAAAPGGQAALRRLYTRPGTGALVAMESRQRRFPGGLAALIGLRDQRCRTPYCDAQIRHRDHAEPWSRGGSTTAGNGLGLCERCNYAKENPGWRVRAGCDDTGQHRAEVTTPTGATYRSTAPPLPRGPGWIDGSELEAKITVEIWNRHAA